MSNESADAEAQTFSETSDADSPIARIALTSGRSNLPYLGLGVVGSGLASVLSRADVFVLGLAFDAMFNDQPYALFFVPDAWIPSDPAGQLWFTVALLLAMKLIDIGAALVGQAGHGIFAHRTLHDVRVDAFDSVQRLELDFFDENRTGEVMSVLNDDVNTLEEFFTFGLLFAVRLVATFVTAIGLMIVLNWQLSLFVLVAIPVVAVVTYWFSNTLGRLESAVRSRVGVLNARIETNLEGVSVIKAFTAERFERDRVESSSFEHYEARWNVRRIAALHAPAMRLISGTTLFVTFLVGTYWVLVAPPPLFSGELTAGQLIPFLFYLQTLTAPSRWMADIVQFHQRAKAAARRIVGVVESDRALEARSVGKREDGTPAMLESVDGRVEYDDVRFSYPGSEDVVVNEVSFEALPDETIGLVGSTGAGKSTLITLLFRFYDVDSGAVRIDGHDVRDLRTRQVRDAIGYVTQEPFLFGGTIRENIAYATPDTDDDAIERAGREAGVDEFVHDLPDGYDTEVGDRGTKLSGGQRQRIAIARAILRDPPIMVFDEATSHVDNETELLIQRNLEALTENRTTFVIAHRLSTVQDADRILVVDDGEIVERGSHDELLERDGAYADLWRVQVGDVDALPDEFVSEAAAVIRDD